MKRKVWVNLARTAGDDGELEFLLEILKEGMVEKGLLVALQALLGSSSLITTTHFQQHFVERATNNAATATYSSSNTRTTSSRLGTVSTDNEPLSFIRFNDTSQSLFALPRALSALRAKR